MDQFTVKDGKKELLFRFQKLQVKQYRRVILFANKIADILSFDLPVAALFDFNQASLRKGKLYPDNEDYETYYNKIKTKFNEEKIVNILLAIDDICVQSDKESDFADVSLNIAQQLMLLLQQDTTNKEKVLEYVNIIKNFTQEQNLSISYQWQNRYKEIKSIILNCIEIFDEDDKTFKKLDFIFNNEKLLDIYDFKSPIIEEKIITQYIIHFCNEIYHELLTTLDIDFNNPEVHSLGK